MVPIKVALFLEEKSCRACKLTQQIVDENAMEKMDMQICHGILI